MIFKSLLSILLVASCGAFSFTAPSSLVKSPTTSLLSAHKLLLIRHGESDWNKKNIFTGWANVPLSPDGEAEAAAGGKLIVAEGFAPDICYTSFLKRAQDTLSICKSEMGIDGKF